MRIVQCGMMACWLVALALPLPAQAQAPTEKQPEWTAEEKERVQEAAKLNAEGVRLSGLGKKREAAEKLEQALAMRQKLYPVARFPDGHPDLAQSLSDLGSVLQSLGEPARARSYQEQALAMRQKLYPAGHFPDGHPDLAGSLDGLGSVLHAPGAAGRGTQVP